MKKRSPNHPAVEACLKPKLEYIQNHIDLVGMRVLDIGCGNGFLTYYLSKITPTVGLDISREILSINPCKQLVLGSALNMPFRDNSFDVVCCANLLHHLESPELAVDEMVRVSKEYIVICEPNKFNPLMALFSLITRGERRLLKLSLKKLLRKLNVIGSCTLGSIVPNKTPLFALKLLQKIDGKYPFGFYRMIIARVK